MKGWEKLFPGMENANGLLVIIALAGFVCSAAIVEEFIFRGIILGWLLRLKCYKTLWAWVFIAAVAFLWALLHTYPNTNRPMVKSLADFFDGRGAWGDGANVGNRFLDHGTCDVEFWRGDDGVCRSGS